MLFRRHAYLPFALKLAKERAGEGKDLSVLSAGCSNCAEIDSILALNRVSSNPRDMSVRGYDVKQELLVDAMRGICLAYDLSRAAELEALGFDTKEVTHVTHVRSQMLEVNAAPLRRNSEVDLVKHDITEQLPEAGERHLVLANNLLYHLSAVEAFRAAYNLASVLSDQGIISFGKDGLAYDSPSDAALIGGMLSDEFGLEPVFTDVDGEPIMFGRA